MKKYIYIVIGLIVLNIAVIALKSTYSSYSSTVSGKTENLTFAKINFNNEEVTETSFSLGNLKPSDEIEYQFKVSNYKNGSGSDLNIGYRLCIETYHFIPTVIELYKKSKETNQAELILTCDESDKRNIENKVVCESDIYTLNYKYQDEDNYLIKIIYNSKDQMQQTWSEDYADLVDFIDVKIDSWQLTEENR